jgi:hypothetical protein
MYRPHFCAECGEQVVRLQWRPWTSRSFCDRCSQRTRRGRLVAPVVAGAALLVGGFSLGHAFRADPPPLMVLRGNLPATAPEQPPTTSAVQTSDATPSGAETVAAKGPAAEDDGPVYICGARTKKGTPCSRRVKGPFRCYQHKGLPAMLPQDQLVVKG